MRHVEQDALVGCPTHAVVQRTPLETDKAWISIAARRTVSEHRAKGNKPLPESVLTSYRDAKTGVARDCDLLFLEE